MTAAVPDPVDPQPIEFINDGEVSVSVDQFGEPIIRRVVARQAEPNRAPLRWVHAERAESAEAQVEQLRAEALERAQIIVGLRREADLATDQLRQAREELTTATAEQVEWLKGLREAAGEPPVDVWLLYSIQQRMESLDELRASAIGNQP